VKVAVFRPAAAADVDDAFRWYESQRENLGEKFLGSVATCVELVLRHPEAHPIVHRDTRRALLQRFPYGLLYRIFNDQILFVACFHVRRNPRAWSVRK
jgi:plasmid stabilization system protein ParE